MGAFHISIQGNAIGAVITFEVFDYWNQRNWGTNTDIHFKTSLSIKKKNNRVIMSKLKKKTLGIESTGIIMHVKRNKDP